MTSAQTIGRRHPQIKICGLTQPQEAARCAAGGADAIGYIFYPPSPRSITAKRAAQISRVLPGAVCPVGVFVDENYDTVMQTAQTAGLRAVQLHGRESPALVDRLRTAGLKVIKALFYNGAPDFKAIARYAADAYLVECVGGPLPGGNALSWNWSATRNLSTIAPVILAGGLTPHNITRAIREAQPDAVDVSSGVEQRPGRKDPAQVRALCRAVSQAAINRPPRAVFN